MCIRDREGTVDTMEHRRALTAFVWWTAWAATTERAGDTGATPTPDASGVVSKKVTYTNNWPSEPLVDNVPPPALWLWSAFSVLFLIAGIAALGWHHAVTHGRGEAPHAIPTSDPFALLRITPSMRATAKYFWVVLALFLAQIPVSYTHLRAHETPEHLVCRLLLEKKKKKTYITITLHTHEN